MAAKDINSGMMLISSEHLMALFHFVDAASISFAQSNITNAKTAKNPYSGSPIAVVIDAVAPFVLTDAIALTNAADAIESNILFCPYSLSLYISFLLSGALLSIVVIVFRILVMCFP
ncbi:hypothetical protein [Methanomethylovorans hollandica]|uniref:hypothetical protein n=1 Tax=Methanomethylovorans hollandica TaxID=101192 RepID=UPI0012E9B75C|nr:hypothetical protein [Methanomethylovorans hollandica]